jgi:hypothetical protein
MGWSIIRKFMFGLRGDVKDLLLTLLNLSTLSQAITQIIQCDNMFFERWQEMHHEPTLTTQRNFTSLVTQKKFPDVMLVQPLATSPHDNPM